jgi:hypothetical protein
MPARSVGRPCVSGHATASFRYPLHHVGRAAPMSAGMRETRPDSGRFAITIMNILEQCKTEISVRPLQAPNRSKRCG